MFTGVVHCTGSTLSIVHRLDLECTHRKIKTLNKRLEPQPLKKDITQLFIKSKTSGIRQTTLCVKPGTIRFRQYLLCLCLSVPTQGYFEVNVCVHFSVENTRYQMTKEVGWKSLKLVGVRSVCLVFTLSEKLHSSTFYKGSTSCGRVSITGQFHLRWMNV